MKNNCSLILSTFNKALARTSFFSIKYYFSYLYVQSDNLVQRCNQDIEKSIKKIMIKVAQIKNKIWMLSSSIKESIKAIIFTIIFLFLK